VTPNLIQFDSASRGRGLCNWNPVSLRLFVGAPFGRFGLANGTSACELSARFVCNNGPGLEVLSMVCRQLPSAALAALERTCRTLRSRLAPAGVWRDKLHRLERGKSYSFVSRVLQYADKNGMTDEKAIKVMLGLRRIIRTTVFNFQTTIYNHRAAITDGTILRGKRFYPTLAMLISKKNSQIKAWSQVMFEEEADYEKCDDHKKLCDEAFAHGGEIDVKAWLERLELQAAKLFPFNLREVTTTFQSLINLP
jgi:hypothetical protein